MVFAAGRQEFQAQRAEKEYRPRLPAGGQSAAVFVDTLEKAAEQFAWSFVAAMERA